MGKRTDRFVNDVEKTKNDMIVFKWSFFKKRKKCVYGLVYTNSIKLFLWSSIIDLYMHNMYMVKYIYKVYTHVSKDQLVYSKSQIYEYIARSHEMSSWNLFQKYDIIKKLLLGIHISGIHCIINCI